MNSTTSLLILALALGGCEKLKPKQPLDTARVRAAAKRHKDACASASAYDRMKRWIFSRASRSVGSQRTALRTLEEFSFVRMEDPVVEGWDPALDLTRCRGRFILDVPLGSETAFGGERRLQADITYTAQGAADASGLVYTISGAEPIIIKLATFKLADADYRPLPAVDSDAAATTVGLSKPARTQDTDRAPPRATSQPSASTSGERLGRDGLASPVAPSRGLEGAAPYPVPPTKPAAPIAVDAEATVRSFYNALGRGDGELASAQVVPAKRRSRAYSPDAISRFYGRLPEPLRLTSVVPLSRDRYRVTYRYAAAGARCNGSAIVTLTLSSNRPLIRSITARSGC